MGQTSSELIKLILEDEYKKLHAAKSAIENKKWQEWRGANKEWTSENPFAKLKSSLRSSQFHHQGRPFSLQIPPRRKPPMTRALSQNQPFQHPRIWNEEWPDWYIIEIRKEYDLTSNWATLGTAHTAGGGISIPGLKNSLGQTTVYCKEDSTTMPKELPLSFSSEVILGWRAWQLTDYERRGGVSEKRIQAVGMKPTWEPYEPNVAICTSQGNHEAPWRSCRCGFWAFKNRTDVEASIHEEYRGLQGKVVGQIAMWGRVLECKRGWRAEFAYPQSFEFIQVPEDIAADVAQRYGVPYSVIDLPRITKNCQGLLKNFHYDFDRTYATIEYSCGNTVRVEISRNFEGLSHLDPYNIAPCPVHNN